MSPDAPWDFIVCLFPEDVDEAFRFPPSIFHLLI